MVKNNQIKTEEFIFNGSPDEFKRLKQGDEWYEFFQEMNERKGPFIDNWDPFSSQRDVGYGYGDGYEWAIKSISDNKSSLFVRVFGSSDYWNAFKSKLKQHGLLEQSVSLSKHRPGRPHLPDDLWAWGQINVLKRNQVEVYKEWVERPGVKARNIIDPERQFKRLSKPDWRNP